jgi:hypothetical protein
MAEELDQGNGLDRLAQKLEEWANGLTEEERVLVQLLLARAKGAQPGEVLEGDFELESIAEAAVRALRPLVGGREVEIDARKPKLWIRASPTWIRQG